MKKLFAMAAFIACSIVGLQAQTQEIPSAKPGVQYGKAITKDQAITVAQLEAKLTDMDAVFNGKIQGEVVEVCEKKGCFIRLKRAGDEEAILVRFKDYGFFMPKDILGKTIVLEGEAKIKEISVETLKHYAEDAGKSPEEIAKITEPKSDIGILAAGVIVIK
jgi:hypothetical protein